MTSIIHKKINGVPPNCGNPQYHSPQTNNEYQQYKAENTILQWNCNGLHTHISEIKMLLSEHMPLFICIQETRLRENKKISLSNYNIYRKDRHYTGHAAGGVAILAKDTIDTKEIQLHTTLEAIAIETNFPRKLTICCIYIPPDENPDEKTLEQLINQLPRPYIILGDFNAHNAIWGSKVTNKRWKVLEHATDNLTLLNDGSPTHICSATGTTSIIDLSFSDPRLASSLSWETLSHPYNSDHIPIKLSLLSKENSHYTTARSQTKRWNLENAKWDLYSELMNAMDTSNANYSDVNQSINDLAEFMTIAAEEAIGYRNFPNRKICVPWWNQECYNAVKQHKKSFYKHKKNPTNENFIEFKKTRAILRLTITTSKKISWEKYVATINEETPTKQLWGKIRRIKGYSASSSEITYLTKDDLNITNPTELSNYFADTFYNQFSNKNYKPEFLQRKQREENLEIKIETDNSNPLNQNITLQELIASINETKQGSSPGPDNIPFEFIKNLPQKIIEHLLKIFNSIWTSNTFPNKWRETIVIPIRKPGKPKTNPSNYRPVSMSNTLCKIMEKIINKRIIWYLEGKNLLETNQCGFRKNRSTTDNLVNLTSEIQQTFKHKQHLIAVFFDLEKAYDRTWRYMIIKALKEHGIQGNTLKFIQNFLQTRLFQVRCNNNVSETKEQETGLPQGSVLSVTLFLIAVNNIVPKNCKLVKTSIFADDIVAYMKGKNINNIRQNLQSFIDKLNEWSLTTGLTFSPSKTKAVHFTRLRKDLRDPELSIGDTNIMYVDNIKFLGITLDKKLTWRPYFDELRTDCYKRMNILKSLTHYDWGTDKQTLLTIYKATIRSKLDYGSIVYATAKKSYIRTIDAIHHTALRLISGAFRTSPVESIQSELGEPSLHKRRIQLTINYITNLATKPNHPTFNTIFENTMDHIHVKQNTPFQNHLHEYLKYLNMSIPKLAKPTTNATPPWCLHQPQFNLDLTKYHKDSTQPETFKILFNEIQKNYKDSKFIYTDASKTEDKIGAAVINGEETLKFHLPSYTSIYTAEIYALLKAVEAINKNHRQQPTNYVICTDSLSSLLSIQNLYPENPITQTLKEMTHQAVTKHPITFMWVPSHVGIKGNEKADEAAKEATKLQIKETTETQVNDFKSHVKNKIQNIWKEEWKTLTNNKLRNIKEDTNRWQTSGTRREQIALTRLRIGHTILTHGHLLEKTNPKRCDTCNCDLTIEHIIGRCTKYTQERNKNNISINLKEALSDNNLKTQNLLKYLHETRLLKKI